jgi:hypothetical protein
MENSEVMRDLTDLVIANTHENISHEDKLISLTKEAKVIEIICPFISVTGIKWLLENKSQTARVVVITELSVRGVISGVQSDEAVSQLIEAGCEVHYLTSELHAKMYWFDQKEVLITSANMTGNGLRRNFELGLAIGPAMFSDAAVKGGTRAFNERLRALFDFLKKRTEPVTSEILNKYRELSKEASEIREATTQLEDLFSEQIAEVPFTSFQRPCPNKQNLSTDLMMTNMFSGFQASHWDVFNHDLEVNQENLSKFRHMLDQQVNPLLRVFYSQLKHEPIFKKHFATLELGFSKNLLLRKRFPHDRYLFLTKARPGKLARLHLGEPSIIIGMGKGDSESGWLEVRTGVEEDTLSELSEAGERLISRMLSNADEVVRRLKMLGEGWHLSHGSFSKGDNYSYLPAWTLSAADLRREISPYLSSREVSDLQIRRKYYLHVEQDSKVILSPKITATIAEDIENLSYFFDLAQK